MSPKSLNVSRRRILLALAWYAEPLHRGVARYAWGANWILNASMAKSADIPRDWQGDGVILVAGMRTDLDEFVTRVGKPAVNIGYHTDNGFPRVAASQPLIAQLAARHFADRGFNQFAFYQRGAAPGESQRLAAFQSALAGAGSFHIIHGNSSGASARAVGGHYHWLGQQLLMLPKPVAVMAEIDDYAAEVIEACVLVGLRVPEDVAVLGVNNSDLCCPFTAVPLSSIDDDMESIGYEAAALLDRIMSGEAPPDHPILIPPRGLIARQSTDMLAIENEDVAAALRAIWSHYTEPITAEKVARSIAVSYRQLHDVFVAHMGHSMAQEIARRRLEHAARLLERTNLKPAVIAQQSGFSTLDHMGKVFRRVLGTTPVAHRRIARKNTHVDAYRS